MRESSQGKNPRRDNRLGTLYSKYVVPWAQTGHVSKQQGREQLKRSAALHLPSFSDHGKEHHQGIASRAVRLRRQVLRRTAQAGASHVLARR